MSAVRHQTVRMPLLAIGALAAALLAPAVVEAREGPSDDASVQPSWPLPPTLRLQPDGPRLFLDLPPEWLPPSEHGAGASSMWSEGLVLIRHSGRSVHVSASLSGTTLNFALENRARSFDVGLVVKPRGAVLVLRFDPLPARVR